MQEHITDKTVALAVQATKLTGRLLAAAMKKAIADMQKQHSKAKTKTFQGKQTVKQLVKQNAGVTNIEISDSNIKSFESIARKYGVDFALKKDATVVPPKWLVFFKARDADALTSAFSEFTAKTLKKTADRPSVMNLLRKMKELVKSPVLDKTKHKDRGGPEL